MKLDKIYSELIGLIKAPRKYELLATLKSPFQLRTPHTETELILGFEEFRGQTALAHSGNLIPKMIDVFLDIVSATKQEDVNRLTRDCVRFVDPYRALLNHAEITERRKSPLSLYQKKMLS